MFVGQKYVNKKEIINRITARIENALDNIRDGEIISDLCSLELIIDLVKAKIEVLKKLARSPLAEDFNPSIYTEDLDSPHLVFGDIDAEYHLRLEGNSNAESTDFLIFEDILDPQDDESFEEEIELLAEEIARECGNPHKFNIREISYIKATHIK